VQVACRTMCMCVIAWSSVSVKTEDFVRKESGVGGRLSTRRICLGLCGRSVGRGGKVTLLTMLIVFFMTVTSFSTLSSI
jgi:hypothetical protein